MDEKNRKTSQGFWEATHAAKPRMRLPSGLVVGTRNLLRILRANVRPGMRVLELGFAPGKQLAYLAGRLGAEVSGIDYSHAGVEHARDLFSSLGLKGDMRCEDFFKASFPRASFDLVYSVGVVEHFDDPKDLIRLHVEFACPGGIAIVLIPNYGGIYGRLQRYFDPENLSIHNLNMMNVKAFASLAPHDLARGVHGFRVGRINPGLVSFHRRWPRPLTLLTTLVVNGIGLLQFMDIGPLCPMLGLRILRKA